MSQVEFEIGNTYENERGEYEVLSIDNNQNEMVIKWEDGKEITTSVELQKRIIERRQIERMMLKKGKNGTGSRKGRPFFKGFEEKDFSGSVAGTTWRTQKSLGGAVTTLLNLDEPQLKSRAVARSPEVHWLEAERRNDAAKGTPAKLFVALDTEYLRYGFYVVRSNRKTGDESDWHRFLEWVADNENEKWLKEITDEYQLRVYDRKEGSRAFDGFFRLSDGSWKLKVDAQESTVESLAAFLEDLSATKAVHLCIAKKTTKSDTLARGAQIVEDIASLFDILMPLYKATALSANS